MGKNVEDQIRELEAAKSQRSYLQKKIRVCNYGIALLRKNGEREKDLVGKPWASIIVRDNYNDGDNWACAEIVLKELSEEQIETLAQIYESQKSDLQAELDELERRYAF